jgi:thiosulfate reductase cytochrome b subunit
VSRLYIHPLAVRVWHWINAAGFVLMILTGVQIRYADMVHWLAFATAVQLHNLVGAVLIANYLVWLLFYLFTDRIRVYHPDLNPARQWRDSLRQLAYYGYGIFKGAPNPHRPAVLRKFNPVQAIVYQIVMILLVPLQFYTGVLLWDLERFAGSVEFFGGVRMVANVHVLLFIFFVAFIFVHPYLASLGHSPTAHFKAMITGYEEVDDAPGSETATQTTAAAGHRA